MAPQRAPNLRLANVCQALDPLQEAQEVLMSLPVMLTGNQLFPVATSSAANRDVVRCGYNRESVGPVRRLFPVTGKVR